MALHPAQPARQLVRVFRRSIDAVHQRIFKNDTPSRLFNVIAAGVQHILKGVMPRDRHKLPAHLVIRRMKG